MFRNSASFYAPQRLQTVRSAGAPFRNMLTCEAVGFSKAKQGSKKYNEAYSVRFSHAFAYIIHLPREEGKNGTARSLCHTYPGGACKNGTRL